MKKWNTFTFVKAFMGGTLGRKRVHGTYRVLDGDHCKVLVRASTNYGRPAGSSLVAIRLNHDTLNVGFFHQHNTNCFTYQMNRDMDIHHALRLPRSVLNEDDPNLIASGIIDVDGNDVLIEIGDKPYLLHRRVLNDGTPMNGWKMSSNEGSNTPLDNPIVKFASLDTLEKRVASIVEARELIKDPEGMEIVCNKWWVEKMHDTFTPPSIENKHIEALSAAVNPLDHGYKLDDCITNLNDDTYGLHGIAPRGTLLTGPHDPRAKSYLAALEAWNEAVRAINDRTPMEWKGLTTKKNRYSYYSAKDERVGYVVITSDGVYLKGIFHTEDNWDTASTLDGWHRAHVQCRKVVLK